MAETARILFRLVLVLHALLAVAQPAAAGTLLEASSAGLTVHQAVGGILLLVAMALVPLAILAWRPGGLPAWPIGVCAALVVAEIAQIAVGSAGALAVHVPLGVTIVAAAVVLAIWSLRAAPVRRASTRAMSSTTR